MREKRDNKLREWRMGGKFLAGCIAAALTIASGALAQSNPRYIAFQPSATKGAL